ncbi:MAG: hypothetical protein LBQ60_03180 [Bacteroidales bacterium]|jgi:hypothetical protein|nr:hypothetical protein [Bacteroidales bacterium]
MAEQLDNIPHQLVDEITQALDCDMICFMNPETLEVEDVPHDVLSGMYYDETFQEALDRVDQWKAFITIDSPDTVQVMKSFVDECVPSGELKEQLHQVLSLRRPDKHFRKIVEDSDYHDKWAKYNRRQVRQHVRSKLNDGIRVKSALPGI